MGQDFCGPAHGTAGPARWKHGTARALLGPGQHGTPPWTVLGLAPRHDGRPGTARRRGPCLGQHGTFVLGRAQSRHGTFVLGAGTARGRTRQCGTQATDHLSHALTLVPLCHRPRP